MQRAAERKEAAWKPAGRKEEKRRGQQKEIQTVRPFTFWKEEARRSPRKLCQTIYLDSTEPVTRSPQPIRQALGDTALRRSDKVETRRGRDGTCPLRSSNIDPCCPVLGEFEGGRKPRKQEDDDPNLVIIGPPLYRNPSSHRKLRRQIDTHQVRTHSFATLLHATQSRREPRGSKSIASIAVRETHRTGWLAQIICRVGATLNSWLNLQSPSQILFCRNPPFLRTLASYTVHLSGGGPNPIGSSYQHKLTTREVDLDSSETDRVQAIRNLPSNSRASSEREKSRRPVFSSPGDRRLGSLSHRRTRSRYQQATTVQ